MKRTLLILVALLPVLTMANTGFNEQFNVRLDRFNDIADRISEYHSSDINLDAQSKQHELEALQQNVEAMIKTAPEDPLLWFISGLNHNNLASFYAAQNQPQRAGEYSERRNHDYQRAMELDQKLPSRLSAQIYAAMKHGLPAEARIEAIKQELAQGGSGENEDYFWQLHWSHVSALDEAGHYDEAEKALQDMQNQMWQRGVTNPDYQIIVDKARTSIQQHRQSTPSKPVTSTQADSRNMLETSQIFFRQHPYIKWIVFGLAIAISALILTFLTKRAFRK